MMTPPAKFKTLLLFHHNGKAMTKYVILMLLTLSATSVLATDLPKADLPSGAKALFEAKCVSCHDAETKSGRLDLTALKYEPGDALNFARWVKVFDRVTAGEMPTKKKLDAAERSAFTKGLEAALLKSESDRIAKEGRSTQRRLNRFEYENTLRDLLGAPWLQLKDTLPEDAVAHGFNKCGDALDISHVQMARYLQAADSALRQVIAHQVTKPVSKTKRYYARDQGSFTGKMFFSVFNTSPERATFPVLGFTGQPDVRTKKQAMSDPKQKELEGVGLVAGAYEPVEPKFDQFHAPMAGHYKLRFMTHTAWVGPDGTSGKTTKWSIPNYDVISKGRRAEPVSVYSEVPPHQLRKIGSFDAEVEPAVKELDVWLLAGETIRPDAARLFRSRPGETRFQNPLAEKDGQPGVVYRWLEVEGPLLEAWPPVGHKLLFGNLPFKTIEKSVQVESLNPMQDAKSLLKQFTTRTYRRPVSDVEAVRFLPVIEARLKGGSNFVDAMIAGYTAVLCSPEFLTLHEAPGKLDDHALAARLAYFLWNSEPDAELRSVAAKGELRKPAVLRHQTDRLLKDSRSRRFVDAFLDYWLDLRKMSGNAPDAALYGDYYLDDWLLESAEVETQLFFAELIKDNLPSRSLIHSDFVMVNERLAKHYDLPPVKGTAIRRVPVPKESVRGGLLTQASVLMVTANGTTTSPVLRGAWILERILGTPTAPPPPVPAVEPDLRGQVTIRDQLAKHRDQASCAACHARIDPPGFALESFDVMGGYRTKYRAIAEKNGEPGLAKSGQPFQFRYGLPVDCSGELAGQKFQSIRDFKQLLFKDETQVARNLAKQLTVYATGSPIGFADRDDIEKMLDDSKTQGYGVRSLIHAVIQSELFLNK
ncbi:hypothetical protein BH11PLA2_BH11PLA2_27540 [soil metagenome]